jgi:hypothetical protein
LDTIENLKKSLTLFGIFWVGFSAFLGMRVVFGNSDDVSELLFLVYILAVVPLIAIETIIFSYLNTNNYHKILKAIVFAFFGALLTSMTYTIGTYIESDNINHDLTLFMGVFGFILHISLSAILPWKSAKYV